MGSKAKKKAVTKTLKKASAQFSASKDATADFLTGKSKHFGFIEFESPEVARVVEECMHNYLMYEHLLQVQLVPPERVHPKLWKGVNRSYQPLDWVQIERKRHDKERTLEQQKKLVAGIMKRDQKRRKRIEAAGFEYECPEIVGCVQAAPKKIRFDEE
ncbi:hypothetical protein DH2020_021466 [Rehmannia glutinosa]|uniref:RRM domain-containing protein n=1 Tax=Rehmannia glutinosa TaxID=99300 RepID=A0ABR0WDJ8_REHGL